MLRIYFIYFFNFLFRNFGSAVILECKICEITMLQKYFNLVNNLCYICDEIRFLLQKQNLILLVKNVYQHYFGIEESHGLNIYDATFLQLYCEHRWITKNNLCILLCCGLAGAYKPYRWLLFLLNSTYKSRFFNKEKRSSSKLKSSIWY